MPKTYSQHVRLTFGGTLGPPAAGLEIWSCGLSIAGAGDLSPQLPPLLFQAVTDRLAAWFSAQASHIGNNCHMMWAKSALIAQNGAVAKNADGSYNQLVRTWSTPLAGGNAYASYPFQVALAVTLQSAASGQTGRGRVFLPLPSLQMSGDGSAFTDAHVLETAGAFATLVTGINSDLSGSTGTPRVVVASGGSVLKGLPPTNHPVTSVRVGHVPDTIRSRRNALEESYVVQAV